MCKEFKHFVFIKNLVAYGIIINLECPDYTPVLTRCHDLIYDIIILPNI
jgi:hypothetical protein